MGYREGLTNSRVSFEDASDLATIHHVHRSASGDHDSHQRENNHAAKENPWEGDVDRKLNERVELDGNSGCSDEADQCAKHSCTDNNDIGLVDVDSESFSTFETHRTEHSIFPDRIIDILS